MTGKPSKRRAGTEQRRERILKAALDEFSNRGYEGATIPEIARVAGVAAGTIYLYYPSKRELFVSVIKNFIITPALLDLIDKIPRGDIDHIFKNILQERFNLIKNPAFARMPWLISEVQRDPELRALWVQDFFSPFLQRLEMLYRAGAMSGEIRTVRPEVAVRIVGGFVIGFLMLRAIEGEASPLLKLDESEIAGDIAAIVLHGLLKAPEGDKK